MQERSYSPALSLPEIQPLLANADYIDVKTVTGKVDLRTFIAGFLNYHPMWMTSLFVVRAVFVRFLGMRQGHPGSGTSLTPQTVPMQVGKRVSFFTAAGIKVDPLHGQC